MRNIYLNYFFDKIPVIEILWNEPHQQIGKFLSTPKQGFKWIISIFAAMRSPSSSREFNKWLPHYNNLLRWFPSLFPHLPLNCLLSAPQSAIAAKRKCRMIFWLVLDEIISIIHYWLLVSAPSSTHLWTSMIDSRRIFWKRKKMRRKMTEWNAQFW